MGINPTSLTAGGSTSISSALNTASVAPVLNQLVLLVIAHHVQGGGAPNTPTVTGAGMTWVQVASYRGVADSAHRITVFKAVNSSPGSGVLTIDFGGQNQDEAAWSVVQFSGGDIGSNAANGVVQAVFNDVTTQNNIAISMGAFGSQLNATYGVCVNNQGIIMTHGSNFTEVNTYTPGGGNGKDAIESQFSGNNQSIVNWTWSGSAQAIAVGLEIKRRKATDAQLIS